MMTATTDIVAWSYTSSHSHTSLLILQPLSWIIQQYNKINKNVAVVDITIKVINSNIK